MGAGEFAEWQVMFANEQLHPAIARARHAQLQAAIYTGPAKPANGKGAHRAESFMASDPWKVLAPRRPPTAAELKAQVAAINASRRKR